MQYTSNDVKGIIAVVNRYTGKSFQYDSVKNKEAAGRALAAADNLDELKNFIAEAKRTNKTYIGDIVQLFDTFVAVKPYLNDIIKSRAPREMTKEEKQMTAAVSSLGDIIAKVVSQADPTGIKEELMESIKKDVNDFIKDTYGPLTRVTNVIVGDKSVVVNSVIHPIFDELLAHVSLGIPTFLAGPAGSGKNHIAKQIADVLGLDFYFSSAVTQEYKISGFTDANGRYQETQFYKAFSNGGLFLFDEIDASDPEVLTTVNTALANGYCDFPAPIGKVYQHKKFRIIAAGNTTGNGADLEYVGRNQLDAATLNRFSLLHMGYDPRIEEAMACGDTDLLGFCRAFRKATEEAGIKNAIVSYRNISNMAKLTELLKPEQIVKSELVKGLDKSDLITIKDKLQGFGKYSLAFNSLCVL